MRLAQFYRNETLQYGVADGNKLYILSELAGCPKTLQALLETAEKERKEILQRYPDAPCCRMDEVTPAPAVTSPQKILCVGLNYGAHACEAGEKLPEFPEIFSKFSNALAADRQKIRLSPFAGQVDYEAELVVVIGRKCAQISEEEAADVIFGFTCGNDLSARQQQLRVSQWLTGKSQDGFAPVGPWIVTADEFSSPSPALDIRMYRGEKLCQKASTGNMIFSVTKIISYLSRYMTLLPGDIIFTGTPEGVILGRKEKNWLHPGEKLTVEIEGIGRLENTIQ